MMKKTSVIAMCLCLTMIACRKSANDCIVTDAEIAQITEAQEAINLTGMKYFQDMTAEHCRDFRDAYQDYLDLAKEKVPCWIPAQREAFEEGIADAEEALAELGCE